jgi:hypothetical protein
VSKDGRRFLRIKDGVAERSLILVQSWSEELKRLVPVN